MIILLAVGRRGRGGAGHFVFRNCCLIFVPKRNLLKLDPIKNVTFVVARGADDRAELDDLSVGVDAINFQKPNQSLEELTFMKAEIAGRLNAYCNCRGAHPQ